MSKSSSRIFRNRLVRLQNLRQATEQEARQTTPETNTSPGFNGRWTRRQWAHASLVATMVALLGTIVPGFATVLQPTAVTPIQTMSLKLPPLSLARQHGQLGDSWQTVAVKRGASLKYMFSSLGIPESELKRVLKHPGVKAEIGQITPDTHLSLDLPVNGKLRAIRFLRRDGQRIQLDLTADRFLERLRGWELTLGE